jgi:transposase
MPIPRRKRRKFTKEFKEEAVRVLEHDERSGAEVARSVGIDRGVLYRWQRELRGKQVAIGTVPKELLPDEREELRRLRREVRQLQMDKEILKKATAFFAKESK